MASHVSSKLYRMLVHSAKQIVMIENSGKTCLKGAEMNHLDVLNELDGDGAALIIDGQGNVLDVGYSSSLRPKYEGLCDSIIDATNMCVVPGLVDGHTHAVWAGDRVHEFAMKLAGASYMDIHKAGGGINFTVEHTRRASEDDLCESLRIRLQQMLSCGTTLAECKSGYGLDWDTELKMLRVMNCAMNDQSVNVELSVTYCAAHSVPKDLTSDEATKAITERYLPQLASLIEASELKVHSIDVFCEKGVFSVDQARSILETGHRVAGLRANFHAEELSCLHSAEMGAHIGASAMSHLEEVCEQGIAAMAAAGCVAVVLPTTAYLLRLKPPPVRDMIAAGVPVALGTDFNPNAYCFSMPIVMHMACVNLRMTMNEALAAATLNAAASLGMSTTHGSLSVGKRGDLLIIDAPRWEHLIYQLGCHNTVIKHVVKGGKIVYSSGSL